MINKKTMKCINCNLPKDNNSKEWLDFKLKEAEEKVAHFEEIKTLNTPQKYFLDFWKEQVRIIKKFNNCKHKFK